MILIDTSSWIHMLRPDGEPEVRDRVTRALVSGQACWCPVVQLEPWNGASGRYERSVIGEIAITLPELEIDDGVWAAAPSEPRP